MKKRPMLCARCCVDLVSKKVSCSLTQTYFACRQYTKLYKHCLISTISNTQALHFDTKWNMKIYIYIYVYICRKASLTSLQNRFVRIPRSENVLEANPLFEIRHQLVQCKCFFQNQFFIARANINIC